MGAPRNAGDSAKVSYIGMNWNDLLKAIIRPATQIIANQVEIRSKLYPEVYYVVRSIIL